MQTKILLKSKLFFISKKVRLDYQCNSCSGNEPALLRRKSLVVEIDICRTRECGGNQTYKEVFPPWKYDVISLVSNPPYVLCPL